MSLSGATGDYSHFTCTRGGLDSRPARLRLLLTETTRASSQYLVAGYPSADCLFACIVSPGMSEGAYDSRFRHAFLIRFTTGDAVK